MDAYELTVEQINSADLSACEYRAARRLLDIVHRETGTVRLDAQGLMWACCVTTWDACRRLLGALQGIDLIRYHAGRDPAHGVEIAFPVWDRVIHFGSRVIQNGSHASTDSALVACPVCQTVIQNGSQNGAEGEFVIENGSPVIQNGSPPHTRIGLVGLDLDPDPDPEDLDPNQPKPDPDARARLRGLLIDVGVSPPAAHRLSDMDVDLGVRMVFDWLPEYQAGLAKVNLLVWRLQHGETAPPLRDSARASPLYRKHFPDLALEPPRAASWHEIADEYNSYTLEATA